MAEGIIQLDSLAGKKVHTWNRTIGANSVEDEFLIPGEYPGPTYSVVAENIALATANSHLLQVMAGASVPVRLRRAQVNQHAIGSASGVVIEIVRLSTAGTGGTVVTPQKYNPADAAAGATAMTLPTAKGTEPGNILYTQATPMNAAQPIPPNVWQWVQMQNGGPIVIPAGATNGIALKNVGAVATDTVDIFLEFVEIGY